MCLGRLSCGNILKAFEKGAKGVLLLGCPRGSCYYDFGHKNAESVFKKALSLLNLLGFKKEQLQMDSIDLSDGAATVDRINSFTRSVL